MKLIVGNLKARMETDNPSILEALYKKYGYRVEGCQYTTAYKKKFWDGKKRYFSKKGEFKTGILHRVLEDLKLINIQDLDIKYEFSPFESSTIKNVKGITYLDFQRETIEECLEAKRCIVKSPVGSGKTVMMAGLIKSLAPRKMVILFKEVGILSQSYEFFKSCGIEDLGINFGNNYIYGDVMLSTVQSIGKIIDTHLDHSEVLMIDEAHQFCNGETTIACIESFPNAQYRFAFTATTPPDIHGTLTLEGAFGKVLETKSIEDLIKDGILTEPLIQIIQNSPTVSPADDDMPYIDIYDKYIVNSSERNALIVNCINTIKISNKNAKILILCKNLNHVKNLSDMVPGAISIEGKHSLTERYASINKFITSKQCSVLIGTNVLQTGINIREVTHMINARGLEGEIPTIQGLGRGVRKSDNKSVLYFYDFYDEVPYLKGHSKSRIKHYENLNFKISYVKL
jgi:superfamily II DNA or RNA helicase